MDFLDVDFSDVDWGNVPTWFGATLTGGSLLLGFYILLRDRRKDTEAQVRQLASWFQYGTNVTGEDVVPNTITVILHNASAGPIIQVSLILEPRTLKEVRRASDGPVDASKSSIPKEGRYVLVLGEAADRQVREIAREGQLLPQFVMYQKPETSISDLEARVLAVGERAKLEFSGIVDMIYYHIDLHIVDAAGRYWSRDLRTGTLRRLD